jgi:hypothetical protein
LRGWDGYLSTNHDVDAKAEFAATDRLFSLSSSTAADVNSILFISVLAFECIVFFKKF